MGKMLKLGRGRLTAIPALLAAVVIVSVAFACYSPSDAYAIEVVLNKPGVSYDLSALTGVARVEYAGGAGYAYRSRYDPRLIVLLSEQEVFGGRHLAVRVQVPLTFAVRTIYRCALPPLLQCYSGQLRENVSISLQPGTGGVTIDLGTLSFRSASFVRFKPDLVAVGHANLTVSGLLVLEPFPELRGAGGEYRIPMPCLLSVNEPCYRIMMLIPGYDAPIRIEEGVYGVKLTLSWQSSSRAELILKRLEVYCEWEVLPQPLEKPGWSLEEGVMTRRVGSSSISVNLRERICEIVVPGEAELPRDAELELAELLGSIGLKGFAPSFTRTVETSTEPAFEIDEAQVRSALKAELEWLIGEGVVKGLEAGDAASIAALAALGNAGFNSRLVWYNGSWTPYNQVPGASMLRCAPAPAEKVFTAESPEYQQLETAQRRTRAPTLPPLLVAGVVALAAAAASYILVKRVLRL